MYVKHDNVARKEERYQQLLRSFLFMSVAARRKNFFVVISLLLDMECFLAEFLESFAF